MRLLIFTCSRTWYEDYNCQLIKKVKKIGEVRHLK